MDRDAELELSEASVAAIMAGIARPVDHVDVLTDEQVWAFALGLTSPSARARTISALARSPVNRMRLVAIHRQVKEDLAKAPAALESSPLRQFLGQALSAYTNLRAWCLSHDWSAMRAEGSFEALGLRAALGAAAERLRLPADAGGFAVARGAEDDGESEIGTPLPLGPDVRLAVHLDEEGALFATAEGLPEALEGRMLYLEMTDPAGSIPVNRAVVKGGVWSVSCPGFSELCDIEPGPQPPSLFRLTVGNGPIRSQRRNLLYATDPSGQSVALQYVEEPRLEGGYLIVTLLAPASVRERQAGRSIEFYVPLGSGFQLLGRWPMAEWTEDIRTFRGEVPTTGEGSIRCGSVLHARFVDG